MLVRLLIRYLAYKYYKLPELKEEIIDIHFLFLDSGLERRTSNLFSLALLMSLKAAELLNEDYKSS